MEEACSCGGKALTPKPAKFSIEDKYGSYRRKAKLEIFKKEGIIEAINCGYYEHLENQ